MRFSRPFLGALLLLATGRAALAALIPGATLPPPAAGNVNFDRDIRPIFEHSCLSCHSAEKPKSHFRLDDAAAALKGGRSGVDIIPGDSARSLLIRYVAGADDDIKMPPAGKGKLTEAEVGLLRAWIDQGVAWGRSSAVPKVLFDVELSLGVNGVRGNESKFRELEGTRQGLGGGVQFSTAEDLGSGEKFSAEGHYRPADQDFQLNLALTKEDTGFVHAGFEQWRKYSENGGAYDPALHPPEFMLNSDLYLNEGRAWVDFGLTRPNFAAVTLGYEYQYRQGQESTLDRGYAQGKNIYPATTSIDESTHVIKLDVSTEWAAWSIEDSARVEIHRENTHDVEPNIFGAGAAPNLLIQTQDNYHSVQGMNTFMVEKQMQDWWRVSAGYYYARLEGGDAFNQATTSAANIPVAGNFWSSPQVTLSTESHIFSLAGLFTPVENLSLSLASQNEWTHEEGFGEADLSTGLPTTPAMFLLLPVSNDSDLDRFKAMQSATARYTKIPWTVLFADLRFSEEEVGEFQEQAGGVPEAFNRKTDADNELYDLRSGFAFSPLRWMSWDTQYRFTSSDTTYNHVIDSTPLTGYPAFVLGRTIETDDVETKLVLRPASWMKTTLSYDIAATDYSTTTDPVAGGISPGGPLTAGVYDARTYGLGMVLTPIRALYFSGAFTYSDSRTTTFANSDPSIVPYQGHIYTLTSSAGYALSKSIELSAAYSFSKSDYGENNAVSGVPLGLNFIRHDLTVGISKKINARLSATLRYLLSHYAEPGTSGINDYNSQGIFATLAYSWR